MAKSSAERTRELRERRKKQAEVEARKLAPKVFRRPFYEFFNTHGDNVSFSMCMDTAGIDIDPFIDDRDPKSASGEIEAIFDNDGTPEDSPYANGGGSLACAELMIEQLIDAAAALAQIVTDYKRDEIEARIAEIEQSDLSDQAAKKQAFADVARLNKMRDQLNKQVRWTFPKWKVTGE